MMPLPPQFGYFLARSDALRTHAIQNMTGTSGHQRVLSDWFNTFQLAVLNGNNDYRFVEFTSPLMTRIKANSEESRALATLRPKLLKRGVEREWCVQRKRGGTCMDISKNRHHDQCDCPGVT